MPVITADNTDDDTADDPTDDTADDVVDTHVHFWDHSVAGLTWSWLEPDFEHPRVRSLHEHDAPRFSAPELRQEVEGSGVGKVVHVQAARWNGRPELETAWLQRLGEDDGWPDAIVGSCRLLADDVPAQLEGQAHHDRFRGVRDLAVPADLDHPKVASNLGLLGRDGLLFEALVTVEQYHQVVHLARTQPEVCIVIDHAGLPVVRTPEYRRKWMQGLEDLARVDNVVCKISALAGSVDPDWTADSLAPWVEGCIEAFGPQRCMFGSNWPIDKPYGRYVDLVDAYRQIIASCSPHERRALLSGTAERIYRI